MRTLEEGLAFLRAEVTRMFMGVVQGEIAADKLLFHPSTGSVCVYVVEERFSKSIDAAIDDIMGARGEPRSGTIPKLDEN